MTEAGLHDLLPHLHDLGLGQADLEGVVASSDSLEIPLLLLNGDGALAVPDDSEEGEGGGHGARVGDDADDNAASKSRPRPNSIS